MLPLAGKVPLVKHGVRDASDDPEVIGHWWWRWPRANVGLRLNGYAVLDTDSTEAEHALEQLQFEHGPLPDSAEVKTQRGRHFYCRLPQGVVGRNRPIAGGMIDVKTGAGAYAVAPPSRHPSGVIYTWTGEGTIAMAPAWLQRLIAPPPAPPRAEPTEPPRHLDGYVQAAVDAELNVLARAVKPGRNNALNKAAFCLFQFTKAGLLGEDWTRTELVRIARDIGLPDRRILPTLDSAWRAAQPRQVRR